MVGEREKTKQARSNRLKEDRISQLPDSLICDILSHLPIEDAVKTSVLSTTWRSLWLWVSSLELNPVYFPDFSTFKSFGDRFFDSNRASLIHQLEFDINGTVDDFSYLKSWIGAAVKRKIQHLHVVCFPQYLYEMPISLFTCETLVYLRLEWGVALPDAEFFALPCLKTMHLVAVLYPNETTFERLVSSCPVLEELMVYLVRNDAKLLRVQSRSLKRLTFMRVSCFPFGSVVGAEIDAPLLGFLSIYDRISNSFVVNNLEANAKLDISLDFGLDTFDEARRSRICSFLPVISRVRDMAVDAGTFKVILDYSKFEPQPQFRSLSCLHIALGVSDLICLPTFLESCPNLKSLVLALDDYEEMRSEKMNQISYSSVPECFLRSLEFVGFKAPISGHAGEMKLVKYFLENSAILKELTLRVNHGSIDYDISKELLEIPRRSATCEVVVI